MIEYHKLSRKQKTPARNFAKYLLKTTPVNPEAKSPLDGPLSTRGAVMLALFKPENVEAALIYTDGKGNFWGDVVLRKPNGKLVQIGTPTSEPDKSREMAEKQLRAIISEIKTARKYPLAEKLRELGIDPETTTLLRVTTPKVGTRFLFVIDSHVPTFGQKFVATMRAKGASDNELTDIAMAMVAHHVEVNAEQNDLVRIYGLEDEEPLQAAAFLVGVGIVNVEVFTKAAAPKK